MMYSKYRDYINTNQMCSKYKDYIQTYPTHQLDVLKMQRLHLHPTHTHQLDVLKI